MFLVFVFSCTKDDERKVMTNQGVTKLRNSNLDHPALSNDVYVFDDSAHFVNYYLALNNLYDSDFDSFDTEMMSFPAIATVYTKLSNDSFVNPADRYQPFLTDPVMQSFINEYFEFAIDDVLVTYINNEQILISDINDVNVRNAIRNITKGSYITKNSVPAGAYLGEDTDIQSFIRTPCTCQISIRQISCSELRISGNCKNLVWGSGGGLVSVYLSTTTQGQPSPFVIPNITINVDGNFETTVDMNDFGLPGPWYIWASANPDCFLGNTVWASYTYEAGVSECDDRERSTPWLWAQDNGVQGMSYQTRFYRSASKANAESTMYSKYWDGAKWKRSRNNLRVSVSENRKNFSCDIYETESDVKQCNLCDKIHVKIDNGHNGHKLPLTHCNGDVTGTFKKTLNWNGQSWEINASTNVDFECCD